MRLAQFLYTMPVRFRPSLLPADRRRVYPRFARSMVFRWP